MTILVPVMIRTFGRTGSTLLMQILGTADTMCFERHYPFEQRYLTYVHNMARMIGAPPQTDENWNNDVLFQCHHKRIGSLPYGCIDAFDKEKLAKRVFVSLWEQFSAEMRSTRGLSNDEPAFYAEKVPTQVANMANDHLQARNIFLLRDPRDEMVSIRSFNEKRGFHSFGWLEEDSDVSYAEKVCSNRRAFLQAMVSFESNHRRIFVRYEDLINHGESEVARLSEWLGAPMFIKKATENKEIQAKHMTSADSASSVERWKNELSDDVLAIFSRELGDELTQLGYRV